MTEYLRAQQSKEARKPQVRLLQDTIREIIGDDPLFKPKSSLELNGLDQNQEASTATDKSVK